VSGTTFEQTGHYWLFNLTRFQQVTITTCTNSIAVDWDTILILYNTGPVLNYITGNDDSGTCAYYVYYSTISGAYNAGSYTIQLSGFSSGSFGEYQLSIQCQNVTTPAPIAKFRLFFVFMHAFFFKLK
jgi:hypothetical protein